MRKLTGYEAEWFRRIANENYIELDGRLYEISVFREKKDITETTVAEDVEDDPELKQRLLKAKKDIQEGNYYSSEEMREMIQRGEI